MLPTRRKSEPTSGELHARSPCEGLSASAVRISRLLSSGLRPVLPPPAGKSNPSCFWQLRASTPGAALRLQHHRDKPESSCSANVGGVLLFTFGLLVTLGTPIRLIRLIWLAYLAGLLCLLGLLAYGLIGLTAAACRLTYLTYLTYLLFFVSK